MFEKEKLVDISAWGYDAPVKLKRMTGQEKANWTNEVARMSNAKIVGKQMTTDLQPGMANIIYLTKIIVDGPIKPDATVLGSLDWELVDYLAQQGEELNAPFVMREPESG
jgi:hypothetical protein